MTEPTRSTLPSDRDPRWRAVVARDRAFDDRFVYSVASTGVYCRPSCGARRPLPRHVRFHASCAEAERAGFHPCKRCRPDAPPLAQRHAATIARLCRLIEAAPEVPALDALAEAADVSPSHLHRLFKSVTGVTPKAYAAACRANRLRDGLARPDASVTEAIYDAGFNSSGRFYAQAAPLLGMTPTAWRRGGAGTTIHSAASRSSLGWVLVARSERGVCAILMGDDPQTLARDLRRRFPQAELIEGDPGFEGLVAVVVGAIEQPAQGLDLPLDVRGTAFQQRVWQALRAIPPGETASYAEIARRLGQPQAARAVASACAANPLALAIPCHRVLRGDGTLSGYRWGLARKRALLKREGAPPDRREKRRERGES